MPVSAEELRSLRLRFHRWRDSKEGVLESLAPTQIHYRDRKVGLMILGILTALMGCFMALCVPLIFWAQIVSAKTTHVPPNFQSMIPAAVSCGLLALVLIWLGIGSILMRRWARALLLIFSWTWLVIGAVLMIYLAFLFPQVIVAVDSNARPGQTKIPEGLKTTLLVVQGIFFMFFYVVLPGIWVLFYRSKNVKTTCEVRDPVPRWTDRCPLPVLAVSLWAAFGAAVMLCCPFANRGVLPLFGIFLSGIWGTAAYVVIAALWGFSARALYRLEWSGWWILLVGTCLFSASAFVTYSRHDLSELYRMMGYPEQQVAQLEQFNVLKSGMLAWSTLIFTLPVVGYLLYLRKFFTRRASSVPR